MKLHDTFLGGGSAAFRGDGAHRGPLGHLKEALYGIGDKDLRGAQDFLWSMGGVQGGEPWRPAIGDKVEFVLPDGSHRVGKVDRLEERNAVVEVADGAYNFVPINVLLPVTTETRQAERRSAVKAALQKGFDIHETRSPIKLSDTDFAVTLEHKVGCRPGAEEIDAYVAAKYPGARIVDGSDIYPGRIGLVLAQLVKPKDPPSSRDNAVGIGKEEIEGTGRIAFDDEGPIGADEDLAPLSNETPTIRDPRFAGWLEDAGTTLQHLAAANPNYDFVETSVEEAHDRAVSHFEVRAEGRRCFVKSGSLTTVLSEGAVPAVGTITVTAEGVEAYLVDSRIAEMAPDQPYASGHGANSVHQDEPGAYETGSYAIQGDVQTEDDGDVREEIGGPGLHIAVDERAKTYWIDYQGEYGEQLTDDVLEPREAQRRVAMIHEAWLEVGRGEPTAADVLLGLDVLAGMDRLLDGMSRTAAPPAGFGQPGDWTNQPGDDGPRGTPQQPAQAPVPLTPEMRKQQPSINPEDPLNVLPQPTSPDNPLSVNPNDAPDKQQQQQQQLDIPPSGAVPLRDALVKAMRLDPRLKQQLQPMIMKELAKLPAGAQNQIKGDEKLMWTKLLPGVLKTLETTQPNLIKKLNYQYNKGSDKGSLLGRGWEKLKAPVRDVGNALKMPSTKTREQMDYAQQLDLKGEGAETAMPGAGAPAAQPAQPATQSTAPRPPSGTAPAAPAGQVNLPKGEIVTNSKNEQIELSGPAMGIFKGPAQAGQPGPSATAARVAEADPMTEAYSGRRQPVLHQLRFRMDEVHRDGGYMVMRVVWDPDATAAMSSGNVVHAVKTFVKMQSTHKESFDFGFISKPIIDEIDLDVGMAVVRFRSSSNAGRPTVRTVSA